LELESQGIIFTAGARRTGQESLDERLGSYDTEAGKTYLLGLMRDVY
jgi:hypothetical protein